MGLAIWLMIDTQGFKHMMSGDCLKTEKNTSPRVAADMTGVVLLSLRV